MPDCEATDKLLDELESQVLYILDGYDELGNLPKTDPVWRLVNKLLRKQHYIVTTRPHYSHDPRFNGVDRRLEIRGFVDENIHAYIQQYFRQDGADATEESQQGKALYDYLSKNKVVWGIAHVPIQLELLCLIWQQDEKLLKTLNVKHVTMTVLYSLITNYLLRRYLDSPPGQRRYSEQPDDKPEAYLQAQCRKEIGLLEYVALHGLLQGELLIEHAVMQRALTFIRNQFGDNRVDSQWVLDTGLLKSVGAGEDRGYYFLHLTFQEYFAASHIEKSLTGKAQWCLGNGEFQLPDGNALRPYQSVQEFITWRKYNARYEVMWWFVVGLLAKEGQTETLLTAMHLDANDVLHLRNALLLIRLLEEDQRNRAQGYWQALFKKLSEYCLFSAGYTGNGLDYDLLSQFNERLTHTLSLSPFLVLNTEFLHPIHDKCVELGVRDASNEKKQLFRFLRNLGQREVALGEGIIDGLFALVIAEVQSSVAHSEAADILREQAQFVEAVQRRIIRLYSSDNHADITVCNRLLSSSGKGEWFFPEKIVSGLMRDLCSDEWDTREKAVVFLTRSKMLGVSTQAKFIDIFNIDPKEDKQYLEKQEAALSVLSVVQDVLCTKLQSTLLGILVNTTDYPLFLAARTVLYKQDKLHEDIAELLVNVLLQNNRVELQEAVKKLLTKCLVNDAMRITFLGQYKGEQREHYQSLFNTLHSESHRVAASPFLSRNIVDIVVRRPNEPDEEIEVPSSVVAADEGLQAALLTVACDDGNPTQHAAREVLALPTTVLSDNTQCQLTNLLTDINGNSRELAASVLKTQRRAYDLAQAQLVKLLHRRFGQVAQEAKAILVVHAAFNGLTDDTQTRLVAMLTTRGQLATIGFEVLNSQTKLNESTQQRLIGLCRQNNAQALNILKNQQRFHPKAQLELIDYPADDGLHVTNDMIGLLLPQAQLDSTTQEKLDELLKDFRKLPMKTLTRMVSVLQNKKSLSESLQLTLLRILQCDAAEFSGDQFSQPNHIFNLRKTVATALSQADLSAVLFHEELSGFRHPRCVSDGNLFVLIYDCFSATPVDTLFGYQQQFGCYAWLTRVIVKRCIREVVPICYDQNTHTLFSSIYPQQQSSSASAASVNAGVFLREMNRYLEKNGMQLCQQAMIGDDYVLPPDESNVDELMQDNKKDADPDYSTFISTLEDEVRAREGNRDGGSDEETISDGGNMQLGHASSSSSSSGSNARYMASLGIMPKPPQAEQSANEQFTDVSRDSSKGITKQADFVV